MIHCLDEDYSKYFEYKHLPEKLQKASKPFCVVAEILMKDFPSNSQRLFALQKLLEAKDCAVRSLLQATKE